MIFIKLCIENKGCLESQEINSIVWRTSLKKRPLTCSAVVYGCFISHRQVNKSKNKSAAL